MNRIWYSVKDVARGLLAVSPLTVLQSFSRPRALPSLHSDVLRAYRNSAGLRSPSILPSDLFEANGPVSLRIGENEVYPLYEPQYLVIELIARLQPRTAFEIGTFRGQITSLIAMNMPEDGCVYTLDLPGGTMPEHASDLQYIVSVDSNVGEFFRNTPWMGKKIHQLRGDSLKFDFSPYEHKMDFVLIDASHTYQAVFSDSLNAFRMIKAGGVILWHDYESMRSEYGVSRFVDRLRTHHHCPTFRLSSEAGDTRYAVLKVDTAIRHTLLNLAEHPDSF